MGTPPTSTVPVVGGYCGESPAIIRRMVDLPHPEGPRMEMNSPRSPRSSTVKSTSFTATRSPYFLLTPRNSTTGGGAAEGGGAPKYSLDASASVATSASPGSGAAGAGASVGAREKRRRIIRPPGAGRSRAA